MVTARSSARMFIQQNEDSQEKCCSAATMMQRTGTDTNSRLNWNEICAIMRKVVRNMMAFPGTVLSEGNMQNEMRVRTEHRTEVKFPASVSQLCTDTVGYTTTMPSLLQAVSRIFRSEELGGVEYSA